MKKTAFIFVSAIFLPTVVLGFLALQSARQQRVLLQSQEAQLRQQDADNLATQIDLAVRVEHENFVKEVAALTAVPDDWHRGGVLFIISGGELTWHGPGAARAAEFIEDNAAFLRGTVAADVYRAAPAALAEVKENLQLRQAQNAYVMKDAERLEDEKVGLPKERTLKQADSQSWASRKVVPQAQMEQNMALPSGFARAEKSRFGGLVEGKDNGILTRFVNDRLEIIFWARNARFPGMIFGVGLLPEDLRAVIEKAVHESAANDGEVLTAVLNDRAVPFAMSPQGREVNGGNWAKPFVAAEIGEVWPHWEVGIYLLDAERLARSAGLSKLVLMTVITSAVAVILFGGFVIWQDTRRQLALVRKKTDFVSNVSHELKTPLTSIRMFAELLQQGRVQEPEKVSRYLRIITVEAERLTRLINNVLDFSRSEKKRKSYRMEPLDLHAVISGVWENHEVHLQEQGFVTAWHAQDGPYPVNGDGDALAQLLVNLLSNAEKYSPGRKEIELHSYAANGEVVVSVLDRGMGVPPGDERKIFEYFYRAHDSLACGIGGTGLGLTLALQIARAHGGGITFERRKDGGSNFSLRLPLMTKGKA